MILGIAVWAGASYSLPVTERKVFLPTPPDVAIRLLNLWGNGQLVVAIDQSLILFFAGFLVSILAGIPLGLLLGRYRILHGLSEVWISILYAMPIVALLPLIIIYYGITFNGQFMLVFLGGLFPIVINAEDGVRNVEATLTEVARSFGASEREILQKIIMPGSVPFIVSGIRIALGRALVSTIVAEWFLGTSGLGGMMFYYSNLLDTTSSFAPIISLAILSIVMTIIISHIERRLVRWRTST